MSSEASRLLREHEKRINDAVALHRPYRAPVWHLVAGRYSADVLGITSEQQIADIEDFIESVGWDGGFILGASGQTEDVTIENVKAMVDFTKEYGA